MTRPDEHSKRAPTRVAALYDIHGNLPALEAVLNEVAQADVDQIVIGGDIVPGPMPREVLARLLELKIPTRFIQGNGDREALNAIAGRPMETVPKQFQEVVRWSAAQLTREQAQLMATWPQTLQVRIEPLGDVLFCHATPWSDVEIISRLTSNDRMAAILKGVTAKIMICGHTHMQFERTVDSYRIVNAGSAGMPYGRPGAYWLILGQEIELRYTSYDLNEAAASIGATNYPEAEDFASRNVLNPPKEEEILSLLAQAEPK